MKESCEAHGSYLVECFDPLGRLKWRDVIDNLVTTQGKNKWVDVHLRNQTQIATWYLGLISSVSYSAVAAADTAAQINGSNGWKEAGPSNAPNYSESTRRTLTVANPASAGAVVASTASVFTASGAGTVKGCFLISDNTKEGTSGTLHSAGLFTGGDKTVGSGDTINVTYTGSLT